MKDILRNSLLSIYANEHEIIDLINQLDLSVLNAKFKQEIYARIDKETFDEVDAYVRGEKMKLYENAIIGATFACTQDLHTLMDFVTSTKEGGVN